MPGGLAARVAGWQRQMANLPGPLAGTGEPSNGEPVMVELYLGGSWVDITSYVMARDGSNRVEITRGRSGEGAEVDPGTCRFQLNNRDGRFSPRNPTSPYYGQLGRNTPLRVSVPDGDARNYRFWGEVSAWPQHWDTTGTDVWVELEASGILRRLLRGAAPTRSVLYRAVTEPQLTGLLAYWPCEDMAGSTTIASAVANGSVMSISGTPELAAYEGFGSSDPLPTMADTSFVGGVARYDDPTATQLRFLLFIPAAGVDDGKVVCTIDQDNLDVEFFELYYNGADGTLSLRALDSDGATLGGFILTPAVDVRGRHVRVSIELQENGANIDGAVRILEVSSAAAVSATGTLSSNVVARVKKVSMCPAQVLGPSTKGLPFSAVGHVTLQNAITDVTELGERLDPSGETAGRRVQRICAQEGIAFESVGGLDDSVAMGPEGRLTPLDLMKECVDADLGVLYETLGVFGIGYRPRTSLYNQDPALTLSYPGGQLAEVPTPVDDEQLVRNRVSATRSNGGTETATLDTGAMSTADPPEGIGVYGEQPTLNVENDSTLADQAAWRLHVGTVDEARFPQIAVNLAHPALVNDPMLKARVLALRAGDRLVVADPPAWLPPDDISQLVLGFSESIDHFEHRLTFTCAPESPYRVGVVDDAVYGRLDTDGSALAESLDTTETAVDVRATSGPRWTKDTADFPFDIRVGGEVMTVAAINDVAYDTFTRTETNTWGTATSGQAWTEVGGAASDRSVNGGKGIITLASAPSTIRRQTIDADIADTEVLVSISPGQVSTGQELVPGILTHFEDLNNFYRARLHFRTDNAVYVVITRGVVEQGAQVDTGLTYAANDVFWLRVRVAGDVVRARAWMDGSPEPPFWQIERTITDHPIASGSVGLSGSGLSGNTNVNPTVAYDGFEVLDPQTFTVTRSVNGVVKAHSAGADVRLAYPTIIGL